MASDVGADLLRGLRRLTRATVGLYVVVLALVIFVWIDSANKRDDLRRDEQRTAQAQVRTNVALCTFKAELERRVQGTEDYLKAHPEGFPGVSAATLRTGLKNQRDTIRSLSALPCPR